MGGLPAMSRPLLVLRLLLLLLLAAAAPARAQVVDVGQASEWKTQLLEQARILKDPSAELSVQQVEERARQPGAFQPIGQLDTPGQVDAAAWWTLVRLENNGTDAHALRLILNPGSIFQSATFYVYRDHTWVPIDASAPSQDTTPTSRADVDRLHSISLVLEPGETDTVFIRTTGVAPVHLAPYLYSQSAFERYLASSALWDGALFGGLLALAWTAAMLSLFARSRGFLLLGLLSSVTLLLEAQRRGYVLEDFSEGNYRSAMALSNLALLLFVSFILEIAKSEKVSVPFRTVLLGWMGYLALASVLSAVGDVYLVQWLTAHVRPFLSITLLVVALLFIKRAVPNRKLMVGIAAFSVARAALFWFETHGSLPPYIEQLSMGALRSNPVLALSQFLVNLTMLAAWVAYVGNQRRDALARIARLQREENERLVAEVARQTSALNDALDYAAEKNRQQTQIVSYISHDLRAPLVTIAGYAQLLNDGATPDQKQPLDAITRSVDYQMLLIEDILGFAAAELRPLSVHPVLTDLPQFLNEITQHATALSAQQHNRFVCEVSGDIPLAAWLDGRRLRQVLLNLLSNAAKFTREGTVSLTLHATPGEANWQLRFVISDTGVGIDEDQRAHIFEAFHQVNPGGEGDGLGLYIAQSIVKSMGGTLSLESALGEGSQFSVTLDARAGDSATTRWTAPTHLPTGGRAVASAATIAPATAQQAPDDLRMPPEPLRVELADLVRAGHLSDAEAWLRETRRQHPDCAPYLDAIDAALSELDFEAVAHLALNRAPRR